MLLRRFRTSGICWSLSSLESALFMPISRREAIFGCGIEIFSDVIKETNVCSWRRARGAPNGCLIHLKNRSESLHALEMHGIASIWFLFCYPRSCQRCEAFADQRALARSTDTGDQREAFFREGNSQILEIMNTGSVKGESRRFRGSLLGGTFFSFAQISAQFEAFNRPPATRQRKSAFLP